MKVYQARLLVRLREILHVPYRAEHVTFAFSTLGMKFIMDVISYLDTIDAYVQPYLIEI